MFYNDVSMDNNVSQPLLPDDDAYIRYIVPFDKNLTYSLILFRVFVCDTRSR